ncbi:MAG: universal stress protein [Candidatus Eisenbacteria bacterium]
MAVQSILVGMDWGEATGALASVAPDLAVALGATIQAVYVEDVELIRATRMPPVPLLPPMGAIPFDTTSTAELEAKFKREESRLGKLFVQLVADTRIKGSFLVERGDVSEILVRESRAHDLLILGRFSEKATEAATLGAHVERIVRKAYCPVLLVPPSCQLGERFLVAYDGSAGAHHALAFAVRLARATEARVSVVSIANEESRRHLLEEAEAYLANHGCIGKMIGRQGDPSEQILAEIRGGEYSLLAMGAYGRSRLKEFFGATATHELLRRAPCATLVVGPMED